jgi:hypothetical protein
MRTASFLTRETFVEFPDYYHTNSTFRRFSKITDANPQQAEYAWGERVLIDFENSRGIKLQGTLARFLPVMSPAKRTR